MNQDPILRVFSIWLWRILFFFVLWFVVFFSIWIWLYIEWDFDMTGILSEITKSINFTLAPAQEIIFRGSLVIGFLTSALVYLLIALWWTRSSQIVYQRGSRLADFRERGEL